MSGHRKWSDIRGQALAGLTSAERAVREDRLALYRTEITVAAAAYRATCTHPRSEPLLLPPIFAEDYHCRDCGLHLLPPDGCPNDLGEPSQND